MADFGDDLEIEGDMYDLMRTTTHPVVRVAERLEYRHRLRVKRPSHCCNLAAGHLMWQQRTRRTRLVGEQQHVFEIFAQDTDDKCKNENVESKKPKQEGL